MHFIIICLLFVCNSLHSSDQNISNLQLRDSFQNTQCIDNQMCCYKAYPSFILKTKIGCLIPFDKRIRKIYGTATGIYGLDFNFQTYKNIYSWISASYATSGGHSIGVHYKTRYHLVPLGCGLKYLQHFCLGDGLLLGEFYVGGGVLYNYIRFNDHSPFVVRHPRKWEFGGIAKIGIIFHPMDCFLIEVFSDYAYMRFPFHGDHKTIRHQVNLSGIIFGVDIGYSW